MEPVVPPAIGTILIAETITPFPGKTVAPPLKKGVEYPLLGVLMDIGGNPHYDVGLASEYEYITSQETGEMLRDGHRIHWCHPSRFTIKPE